MHVKVFLGPMGAGKSTLLIQDYHNFSKNGYTISVLTGSESGLVHSRIGPELEAQTVRDSIDKYILSSDCILIDECQFVEPGIVKQICFSGVPMVRAYGLLSDFSGKLFEGTGSWLTYADEVKFLHGAVLCWCGSHATMNARIVNGKVVKDGPTIVEGDIEESEVYYVPLCRVHWKNNIRSGRFWKN